MPEDKRIRGGSWSVYDGSWRVCTRCQIMFNLKARQEMLQRTEANPSFLIFPFILPKQQSSPKLGPLYPRMWNRWANFLRLLNLSSWHSQSITATTILLLPLGTVFSHFKATCLRVLSFLRCISKEPHETQPDTQHIKCINWIPVDTLWEWRESFQRIYFAKMNISFYLIIGW